MTIEELIAAGMKLEAPARAQLARELLMSLEDHGINYDGATNLTTIDLLTPVDRPGGEPLSRVTMREPNVGDMEQTAIAGEKEPGSQGFVLVSQLAQLPLPVLRRMRWPDFKRLDKVAQRYMGNAD